MDMDITLGCDENLIRFWPNFQGHNGAKKVKFEHWGGGFFSLKKTNKTNYFDLQ